MGTIFRPPLIERTPTVWRPREFSELIYNFALNVSVPVTIVHLRPPLIQNIPRPKRAADSAIDQFINIAVLPVAPKPAVPQDIDLPRRVKRIDPDVFGISTVSVALVQTPFFTQENQGTQIKRRLDINKGLNLALGSPPGPKPAFWQDDIAAYPIPARRLVGQDPSPSFLTITIVQTGPTSWVDDIMAPPVRWRRNITPEPHSSFETLHITPIAPLHWTDDVLPAKMRQPLKWDEPYQRALLSVPIRAPFLPVDIWDQPNLPPRTKPLVINRAGDVPINLLLFPPPPTPKKVVATKQFIGEIQQLGISAILDSSMGIT